MTNISDAAAAARESARSTTGQFGEQERTDAEVGLPAPDSGTEPNPPEEMEAGFVRVGDAVPFRDQYGYLNKQIWTAYERNREFRRRYKAAGRPDVMPVVGVERSSFDPHTDNTLLLDLGDGDDPFPLDFHRESSLLINRPQD